jgi:hypothetical protein
VTSPPSVKPEENAQREKNVKTIPVRSQQETKKKNSGLTSVRVRINENGLLVRSIVVRGTLTISMECLGHEALRGHVQCVYRITAVPISLSLVTQAVLLENLHRFDTMIVEEVAKKGRHTVTRLGARFVERRTRRTVGWQRPWSLHPSASCGRFRGQADQSACACGQARKQ